MDFMLLFICVFLCLNHPTKLTVVWYRPDLAVVYPHMNHCTRFYVSVVLAQACPNYINCYFVISYLCGIIILYVNPRAYW